MVPQRVSRIDDAGPEEGLGVVEEVLVVDASVLPRPSRYPFATSIMVVW